MRLTSFTDYSLRVLIYLAVQPTGQATIEEIAKSFGISEHHLVKVVHFLGKAGFLVTTRGCNGGLRLAAPADSIGVAEVVRETEGSPVPVECFKRDSNTCRITSVCRLRGVLGEAVNAFYSVLENYTLQDLVSNRRLLAGILFKATPFRGKGKSRNIRGQRSVLVS